MWLIFKDVLTYGTLFGVILLAILYVWIKSVEDDLQALNYASSYVSVSQNTYKLGECITKDDFTQNGDTIKQSDDVAYILQTTRRATK